MNTDVLVIAIDSDDFDDFMERNPNILDWNSLATRIGDMKAYDLVQTVSELDLG